MKKKQFNTRRTREKPKKPKGVRCNWPFGKKSKPRYGGK